jgi:hypothetical protein
MKTDTVQQINSVINEALAELKNLLAVQHLRINIMIPQDDSLRIIANTDGYQEGETTILLKSGEACAGKAWANKLDVIADLTKTKDPVKDWDIPAEENQKVNKNLKSILSVPIYAPNTYDPALGEGDVIAILNVDSEEMITAKFPGLSSTILQRYINNLSHILTEVENA